MERHADNLDDLERRFMELVRKPAKSADDIRQQQVARTLLEEALRLQSSSLIQSLTSVGVKVDSVWDLVNSRARYEKAIPILLGHVRRPYHSRTKEGIVRALAVKYAKNTGASSILLAEYQNTPKDQYHLRWAIGNTLATIATVSDFTRLSEIVLDESNSDSRQMFVRAIAKLQHPDVKDILTRLEKSPNRIIAREAQKILAWHSRHNKS